MINFKKTLTATLAAATLGLTLAASATPAAAWGHKHHGWGGAGIAAGVIGALAVGAIAANAGSGAYGGECYLERRAVTNYYGDVVGYRRVRVCN